MRTPHGFWKLKRFLRKGAKQQRSRGFTLLALGFFDVLLLCVKTPTTAAEPMQALSKEPLHFPSVAPVPAAETGKTFQVLHGFEMQLIAAEPLVYSPVAVTYDEDGRAFVCEMRDYPYTDKAHHKSGQENPTDAPIGRVRMLEDTDGDGVFDKSTVFADGLSWPTGAACWKGGIIVVATPDIWYFKDTKGTGVADVRQKLFTGLKKLNVQAVANNPVWGLDNKIYIAGGSNGGTLQNLVHPEEKPITFRRNDLILDPVKMTIELASGGARFGNTRDDWGNRFLCNIRNPLEHVVLEQRYLARNPYLPPTSPLQDVAESGDQLPVHRISPPEAWREYRAKRWSADPAVTAHMPRSELVGAGVVTSSSGCTIYRGDAYPPEYRGMAFVCECAGNLLYRLKLTPDGVTFKGTRIDGDKEMVASRDIWFRPTNFCNAPDGTLTVCDMYREVIEHPWSLPEDIHAALDLERGRDKGRLYRLAPPGFKAKKIEPLGKKSTAELVKLLAHPNAWHRDTAHRLLFERQDKEAVKALRSMALQSRDEASLKPDSGASENDALARVEAMWVLEGLGGLENEMIPKLLADKNSEVLGAIMRVVESRLSSLPDETQDKMKKLGGDESKSVRFQALLSTGIAGKVSSLLASSPSQKKRDIADPWMCTALLCDPKLVINAGLLPIVFDDGDEHLGRFLEDVGLVIGGRNDKDELRWFAANLLTNSELRPLTSESGLSGFIRGLAKHGVSLVDVYRFNPEWSQKWLAKVIAKNTKIALDVDVATDDRIRAIALLALLDFPRLRPIAAKLLLPAQPDAIRLATIKLLGQQRDAKVAYLLLEAWPTLTPAPREAALQVFLSRGPSAAALLAAVEEGKIKAAEIGPTTRTLLAKSADVKLRERAAKVFGGNASRAEVVAKYQSALALKGDAEAGHKIYQTICAACHRKGDEGRDIGPNLATVQNWPPEQILVNVLDPNREVVANFLLYVVETTDGRTLSGLITNETAGSIGLKGADGVEQSVPRAEIKSLKSTGLSLMPEGLEAGINPQQMADVIEFLRK
jgi:putative membrane-bound dehydrogenase-like protein